MADVQLRPPLLRHDGFLPHDRCAEIVAGFQAVAADPIANSEPAAIRRHPQRTEISARAVRDRLGADVERRVAETRQRILREVRAFFRVPPLVIDLTLLSEMREGDSHILHADNCRRNQSGGWEANHTPWREYAALLYLNTNGRDYDGGELSFPASGELIAPRAGTLVAFSCGREREHEVVPIRRGSRHSMSIWMTTDSSYAEAWE